MSHFLLSTVVISDQLYKEVPLCAWSLILYQFCRPNYIVGWVWFHWKGWNVYKREWVSFTLHDKVYNLSKVDAHTGMCGDLALELSTRNKIEKLLSNWRKLHPVWNFLHSLEIIEISLLEKLESAVAAWLLSKYSVFTNEWCSFKS